MRSNKAALDFLDRFLAESSLSLNDISSGDYKANSWIKERNMSLHEQRTRQRKRVGLSDIL